MITEPHLDKAGRVLSVSHDAMMAEMLRDDAGFRRAMLREIAHSLLTDDAEIGFSLLADYVRATVGFAKLEHALHRPAGSLEASMENKDELLATDAFAVIAHLQKLEGENFSVLQQAA